MSQGAPPPVVVDGRRVRGMLVDLDGTLVNTVAPPMNRTAWLAAVTALRAPLAERTRMAPPEVAQLLQDTAAVFWDDAERHRWGRLHPVLQRERVVREALCTLGIHDPELVRALAAAYAADKHRQFHLFAGALPALARLCALGLTLVLVTNGEGVSQREKIERFDLARWFAAILIEGEQGVGKPDPEMYRRALIAGHLDPDATIMVGDNVEWEVWAPSRLGMRTVWVRSPHAGARLGLGPAPWSVVGAFADVPGLLEGREPGCLPCAP